MNNDDLIWVILFIVLVGFVSHDMGKNQAKESIAELKIEFSNLNQKYTQLQQDYAVLQEENRMLKQQQRELSEQISYYLLEQGAIDLLGLKKYSLAYGLIKINLCNQEPTIPFC